MERLEWSGQAEYLINSWRNWTVGGKKVGDTKSSGLLTVATIDGAGHMISRFHLQLTAFTDGRNLRPSRQTDRSAATNLPLVEERKSLIRAEAGDTGGSCQAQVLAVMSGRDGQEQGSFEHEKHFLNGTEMKLKADTFIRTLLRV